MGKTIATCFKRVGANGATMVEDGQVHARTAPLLSLPYGVESRCSPLSCLLNCECPAPTSIMLPPHPLSIAYLSHSFQCYPLTLTRFRRLSPRALCQTLIDEIDFTEGMEIERGYLSPYFVQNQELQTCEFTNPKILITDRKIANMNELVPLLEGLIKTKVISDAWESVVGGEWGVLYQYLHAVGWRDIGGQHLLVG